MKKSIFILFILLVDLFSNEYGLSNKEEKYLSINNIEIEKYLKDNQDLLKYYDGYLSKYRLVDKKERYVLRGTYDYKYVKKGNYGLIKRRNHKTLEEEIVLDINKLASNHKYYNFAFYSISNDHNLIAFTDDKKGDGNHTLNIYNINTKELKITKIKDLTRTIVWDVKSENIYILGNEKKTYRTNKLLKYNLKTDIAKLIYEEKDSNLVMSLYKASNQNYALLSFNDYTSSFQKIINLREEQSLKDIKNYKKGVEYYLNIINDDVFIYSNKDKKFSIYKTNIRNISSKPWKNIYSSKKDFEIEKWVVLKEFIVLQENKGSLVNLVVLNHNGQLIHNKNLTNNSNTAWLGNNSYSNTNKIRIRTQSLTKTPSWIEFDLKNGKFKTLIKEKYSNFNENNYETKEIFVDNNGIKIPVSLAYNKNKITKTSPVYLYVYGAYDFHMKKYFMKNILSLLDKGFIYAIAHVRGGNYLGKSWSKNGIGEHRLNSINDFLKVAKYLKTYKNGKDRNIVAEGSSAGGTIVSAALNKKPELFKAVLLKVAFLDVLNTLKDKDLSYKTIEFAQWGNPNIKKELNILKGYDPILNIKRQKYPNMLVKIALSDSRVPYKQGLEYIKKIRESSTSSNKYLLYTNFNAGHQSNSKDILFENSLDFTFILNEGLK